MRKSFVALVCALMMGAAVGAAGASASTARSPGSAVLPWPVYATGATALRAAKGSKWWEVEPRPQPGLELVGVQPVRPRLFELSFRTPDLPGITEAVRILLPPAYASTRARYPTLYLLHGCCNGANPSGARNWTDAGKAEALTLNAGAIVVMPDGGSGGMYVDWKNGEWRYESFIIDQLLPWVDLHLRTIPQREARAIAGLSMGGYGSMYLSARHPDLFASEAAFSGIVDLLHPTGWSSAFSEVGLSVAVQGGTPDGVFGDLATDAIDWHDHNPADLAVNLRDSIAPYLEYGDPPTDLIEATANLENKSLQSALAGVGIHPTVKGYPFQGHTYTVWNDGLKSFLPIAEGEWQHRLPAPDGFTYTTAAAGFTAFNYAVELTRPVREFATLAGVRAGGFRLTGSGTAAVTTASRYRPGGRYRVHTPGGASVLRADHLGRLTIPINLGPSATVDEYAPTDSGARPAQTVTVTISRWRRHR
jgi:S-formylglutathione hydrolase FrmB